MVERLVSVKVLASVGMVPSGHSSPQSARRRGWLVRSRSISRSANNGQLGLGRDLRQTEQQCPELALFGHGAKSELSPECEPKRTSTDHYARRHPAGLDLAPACDEMAVRALTRFRPPRARGLVGEAAIGSRPGNCFGNCRLNEGPPTLTRRAAAMHLHTYRDESRSRHLDLIGGRGHPWSIDLVVVIASGILWMGFACAFAALLIR